MRQGEGEQVEETFRNHFHMNLIHVRAQDRFLAALEGVTDPEEKRKIIGRVFIEIFEEEARKLSNANWLAQGTIYPDVIESAGSKNSHLIKSHHNVGGLPDYMKLELVEPLRELFKDEVRRIGMALGLEPEMVYRHPFPGRTRNGKRNLEALGHLRYHRIFGPDRGYAHTQLGGKRLCGLHL